MQVKLFKSLWEYVEFTGSPLTIRLKPDIEAQLERIAAAGYSGIEAPLPVREQEEEFVRLLDRYQLAYIAQVITMGEHGSSFAKQVRRAAAFHPVKIVSHSAKDSMPWPEQLAFFRHALAEERDIGIAVAHETHRGRAMYAPWHTARLLETFEELKLAADYSHWCCVCESNLEDQQDNLALAHARAIHMHGRVGYAEGPQVADPRAPEYSRQLAAHLAWWEQIYREQARRGVAEITFTPEFGPPGYLHTLPFTNQPVADLWQINLWMANTFAERFKQLFAGGFSSEG